MPELSLGFFALEEIKRSEGYLGALLVTDELTKPEEFRVTFPVKPSLMQKRLYGEALIPHIGIKLCAEPLFEALANKPEILLINDQRFLSLSEQIPAQVVYLERAGESVHIDESDRQTGVLQSSSGIFDPIELTFPPSHVQTEDDKIMKIMKRISSAVDPLEPFARIGTAVEALIDEDSRFQ
ncbi:MAG: hypothetical protein R6V13_13175 [Anaerolineae bacterium]